MKLKAYTMPVLMFCTCNLTDIITSSLVTPTSDPMIEDKDWNF